MRQEFIEVFLEIVKTQNLTKAAEHLHLSQSAVSQHLKLLEQELGVQLVIRRKGQRTIELTCQGEEFVSMAESWMLLLQQTEQLRYSATQEINIGSIDSLNSCILPAVCQQMLSQLPSLNLRICTDQSLQLYQLAENREIDIGFVSYQATFPHVNVRPVLEQKMCVIRNCQLSKLGANAHPSCLSASDEIRQNWGHHYRDWHDQWWDPKNHPHIVTDSIILLRHFLKTPGCWAVIPQIELQNEFDLPLEICDFGPYNPPNRQIYLIEPHYDRPNRRDAVLRFKQELEAFVTAAPTLQWSQP